MEGALDDGMGFDGSSITGFNAIEESDMVAIPDPATFQVMPRPIDEHGHEIGAKVARLICDVVKPDGTPYEGDPRFVLRARSTGCRGSASTRSTSARLEYFLFEDNDTKTLDEGGYFAMTAQDAATEVRNDTIHALESVGIPIEYHHHGRAVAARDRHALRGRARDGRPRDHLPDDREGGRAWHGYYATFMPKPLFGENGSGMHTHMSLFKNGRNQFFDARPAPSVHDREVVHRGPAAPRPRCPPCTVGQLVQAARPRFGRRSSPGRGETARR